jgi:hypothetical protein
MTKQDLAVPWRLRVTGEPRHLLPSILLAGFIAGLAIAGAVEAKQQCSVSAGSQGYWSWRMIDGRKCWYEGKPMLSRAMLEWPAESAAQPDTKADTVSIAPASRRSESQRSESQRAESQRTESQRAESHGDPMDAQAYAPAISPTFEALWRDRIEGSRK